MSRRTARQNPGARRVTHADLILLQHVPGVCGAFSTRHAERFWGRSRAAVRKRLRTLYDLQVLKVHLDRGDLTRPNWYTLTPRGAAAIARVSGRDADTYPVRRHLPRQLDHHSVIVDHLVDMTRAGAHMTRATLTRVRLPGLARTKRTVVPDLIADLVVLDTPYRLLVEVDMGTESPNQVAAKVRAYADLHASWNAGALRVLFTVPSTRRRNRLLLRLAEEEIPPGLIFLATQEEVTFRTIFASGTWRRVAVDADGVLRAPRADLLGDDREGGSR